MSALKIVVADDSRTVRTQLRRYLAPAGYDVYDATTGLEAIQQITVHQPFVAILDINMPELDGYGVCLKLKELGPPQSEIPIILLTSLASHALELLGGAVGVYLKKPIDNKTLLDAVTSFLPAGVRR